MTFGFWKRLLNLRLLRSFLKGVHEPVRLILFLPVTMFFRLQRYVVSGGIALQNREVFSYLQIFSFVFVLVFLFRLSVLFVCYSTPDRSFFPITCWVSSML